MKIESPLAEKCIWLRKTIFPLFQISYFKVIQKLKTTFATTWEILPHSIAIHIIIEKRGTESHVIISLP